MQYSPRVCIPSQTGEYVCILNTLNPDDPAFERYGRKNIVNVTLLLVGWISLLGDSPLATSKPNYKINRFRKRLENDLFGTLEAFSSLAHELSNTYERTEEDGSIIGTFIDGFKQTPVFKEYLAFHRTRDPVLLRYLFSFLRFGKKLNYVDPTLETTALRGWLEVEDGLRSLELPAWTSNLRLIIGEIFKGWKVDHYLPRHGGGAVAERKIRGVGAKCSQFPTDEKIAYAFRKSNFNIINDVETDYYPITRKKGRLVPRSRKASRLKFVPKSYDKLRSICMEPMAYQYAQQGVRLWYERHLSWSILKNNVRLEDQGANRMGAQIGSKTGKRDTIDLSSASDSVSWQLIKATYPPGVLKYLAATRTRYVELPAGEVLEVLKYAPMGSALCFPVQSTLYSAVVLMVSVAQAFGRDWRKEGAFDDLNLADAVDYCYGPSTLRSEDPPFQPFHVFGDDIITDHRITSNVIESLKALGFSVNVDKSYTGRKVYRESCGGHYFDGHDISPFILKAKRLSKSMSIEALTGLIDQCNRALDFGYLHLRRHLVQFCLHYPIQGVEQCKGRRNPILFTTDPDQSCAILCYTKPHNLHLRSRGYQSGVKKPPPDQRWKKDWNNHRKRAKRHDYGNSSHITLQRAELRSIAPRPCDKVDHPKGLDEYYLTTWWRSRYLGGGTDPFGSAPEKADALGVGIQWRWTATGT